MITAAISQGVDSDLLQRGQSARQPAMPRALSAPVQDPPSPLPSIHSEDSLVGEYEINDQELSEDEGLIQDKPAFSGLFRSTLFKSLLYKANMGGISILGPQFEGLKAKDRKAEMTLHKTSGFEWLQWLPFLIGLP